MPNLFRSQKSAFNLIARWGGWGQLVRAGVPRDAMMGRQEYKPTERGLFQDGTERIYIAAYKLDLPPPDFEQDLIWFKGDAALTSEYRITAEPLGPRPSGIVMFYDCNVVKLREF